MVRPFCAPRGDGTADLDLHVFNTLAPVFLIIGLGALLRYLRMMPAELTGGINKLTYWVALPSLLFFESARARVDFLEHADAFWVMFWGMMACTAAGYAAAWAIRFKKPGSLAHAAYRGNLAFIGFPVVVYGMNGSGSDAVAIAVLMLAAIIPFYNIIAVLMLLGDQHRLGPRALWVMTKQIATNPLVIASAGGLAVAWLELELPLAASRTLEALGKMALPLALIVIGATLEFKVMRGLFAPILAASLIKVAFGPLAGFLLARWLGLTAEETRVAMILLATPTATSSYVMADQLGGDAPMTAGAIVLSTLLSMASLFVVIWI